MVTTVQKVCNIATGFILSLLVLSPLMAEDIEIYVGANAGASNVPPNILFVVDTSGSMRTGVEQTIEVGSIGVNYDPAFTYSNGAGGCVAGRLYWKIESGGDVDCNVSSSYLSTRSKYKCQAGEDAIGSVGFFNNQALQWRNRAWRTLQNNTNRPIECKDDSGIHGIDASNSRKFANKNGTGGANRWTTNGANEVSWGTSYTFYDGNYLNFQAISAGGGGVITETIYRQRIEVVKDAIYNLVSTMNNVNIGLMRFDRDASGGMVVAPVGAVDTVRDNFLFELYSMYPNGGTPLAETLYEAGLYFRGLSPYYGASSEDRFYDVLDPSAISPTEVPWRGSYTGDSSSNFSYGDNEGFYEYANGNSVPNKTLARNSVAASKSGGKYISPIDFDCQKNYIVFLTDGEPSSSDDPPSSNANFSYNACNKKYSSTGSDTENCLPQVAEALADSNLAEGKRVSTYTIGFATDQTLLADAAAKSKEQSGYGKYDIADDAASLATVFNNILIDILTTSSTFTSPAVSVNAFNRTTHRDTLYYTLFKPSSGPHWDGNLKRYRLKFKPDGSPEIVGQDDLAAINTTEGEDGFFLGTAFSFWSAQADGKEAADGGAASKLAGPSPTFTAYRKVFTNISGDTLTDANNALSKSNTAIITTHLGVATTTERDKLLQWAEGLDVDDINENGSTNDARTIMADPLHSKPALIQYGGLDTDPYMVAFVATNDGYLHAIDTRKNEGDELFSFVPKELLGQLKDYYKDSESQARPYGLDGDVVTWVNDKNRNGKIEGTDHVYIYFGMRRGGSNIYAMDVTEMGQDGNGIKPKMKWTIEGGAGDFAQLGQTWSAPVFRKIKVNGVITPVLVFGGGYDETQDSPVRQTDGIGKAVYIVHAETGARLWWAGEDSGANVTLPTMEYSMPASVSAVDVDADGLLDIVYAADMGGQVFRFDFPGGEIESSTYKGGRIAELAGNGADEARRFYYSPDVAIVKNRDRTPTLVLTMSSGYRAHPNNLDTKDRIYVMRDSFPVSGVAPTYSAITDSDLYDATSNVIGGADKAASDTALALLKTKKGWYIDLEDPGEKGLANPFIFNNKVFITTFVPSGGAAGTCEPMEGSGYLYIMNLLDAQAVYNEDLTLEEPLDPKRKIKLDARGIAADPTLIKITDEKPVLCIGTECAAIDGTDNMKSEYWFEQ
jgi:type IV pilus assembly protein PilY1